MNVSQVDRLPTLFAYPLSRYKHSSVWEPRTLFMIVETFVMYFENLLRAQLGDESELTRPAAMGQRVERCLILSSKLKEQGREPLLALFEDEKENPDLRLLMSTRNRWVHSEPVTKPDRVKLDTALLRILSHSELVQIAAVLNVQQGELSVKMLMGLSGLFGGQSMRLPNEGECFVVDTEHPRVIAIPSVGRPLNLYPYFVHQTGSAGENRIKLLSRVSGGKREYFDPFDAIGSPTGDV